MDLARGPPGRQVLGVYPASDEAVKNVKIGYSHICH